MVPLVMPVPVLVRAHFGRGVGGEGGDEESEEASREAKSEGQTEVHDRVEFCD